MKSEKAGLSEMLSYGGIQFSSTIFIAFSSYYLMSFYTDVALIPPTVTATVLMSLHFCSAIDGQIAGVFINRLNFRQGKYRPYFKWLAFPLAISLILMVLVPDASLGVRIVYAVITLFVCQLICTVLDMSAWACLPHIALGDEERTKFVSFAVAFSVVAFILVGTFMIPLVDFLGGGDDKTGYALTMALFAAIAAPLLINGYHRLKERHFVTQTEKPSIRVVFSAIIGRKRIRLFMAGYCLYATADSIRSQTTYFFMTYNMDRLDLLPVIIMAGILASFLMQPVIPILLSRFKKETLLAAGLIAASIASFLVLFVGDSISFLIVCVVLYGIFTAIFANLVFTVMASFADEIREHHSINISEFLTATMRFSSKLGISIASGVAPFTLALTGYSAQADYQTPEALMGIRVLYVICTAAGMALAGAVFLRLNKQQIQHSD